MRIRRLAARHAYPVAVAALLAGIVLLGTFLAAVALPDVIRTSATRLPSASPRPLASPTASPRATSAMARSPIGIAMPPDADCAACHTTTSGNVGLRQIPYLAHPLKGFADCTACHRPQGLVTTAAGHTGLHANDCLVCHQENPRLNSMSPAPMRPEHMGNSGAACTTCHGVDKHAPLPSAMAGRNNCWICHNGPEFSYLFGAGPSGASAPPRASAQPGSPTAYPLLTPSPAAP